MIEYEQFKVDIKRFFNDYRQLCRLQDRAADYTLDLDAIHELQQRYNFLENQFRCEYDGYWKVFISVAPDGTETLSKKKIKNGKYEHLKPYTDLTKYHNAIDAILAFRKNNNIITDDLSLCCSQDEYYELLDQSHQLEESIKRKTEKLLSVKEKIRLYEAVHANK